MSFHSKSRLKVLFLCTGNSCRSQMAEGWTRFLKNEQIEVFSAGVETHGVNPLAVKVMAEAGVDISSHSSTHVYDLLHLPFDAVITVCDNARESCPIFPRPVKQIHRSFDDPPGLAKSAGSIEEALDIYRRVRDEIKSFVESLPESLSDQDAGG